MAKILFGGPENDPDIHNGLVDRLRAEGHEVDYIADGEGMLNALNMQSIMLENHRLSKNLKNKFKPYDKVIYDTGLFWGQTGPERRAELFEEPVMDYLRFARTPVIVLAEPEMAGLIRETLSEQDNFTQIDQPYNLDNVMEHIGIAYTPE